MSLVPELEGDSLSDGRLTGEFLTLEEGRLLATLQLFESLNRNLRVSDFWVSRLGFRTERMLDRSK